MLSKPPAAPVMPGVEQAVLSPAPGGRVISDLYGYHHSLLAEGIQVSGGGGPLSNSRRGAVWPEGGTKAAGARDWVSLCF